MSQRSNSRQSSFFNRVSKRVALAIGFVLPAAMSLSAGAQMQIVPTITTIAGTGSAGYSGNSGIATSAQLSQPTGIAVDTAGDVYFSDTANHVVRRVDAATGVITTVAGNGTAGASGDGGLATSASLSTPVGVAVDTAGNVYISDQSSFSVRKVNAVTGIITTYAGTGTAGSSGDNGPATSAQLKNPYALALDQAGNLYIADGTGFRVRKVAASTGIITTVAGNGTSTVSGDGGAATSAGLGATYTVAVDSQQNIYIGAGGFPPVHKVRMVNGSTGIITTVAGGSTGGYSGDGGPATSAQLGSPVGVAVDAAGNLYAIDTTNYHMRKVTGGIITTIAGNGTAGYTGDGGPATNAEIHGNYVVADQFGNVYFSEPANNVIRKLTPSTIISFPATTVGTTSSSQTIYLEASTAETISSITAPHSQGGKQEYAISGITGCAVDGATSNPQGTICAVTITFTPGYSGNRWVPLQVVTSAGNINFGLEGIGVGPVAALTPGIISTVVGNGTAGYTGDGGASLSAELNGPYDTAVDSAGNLYIADSKNNVVRKVSAATGIVTTVAGNGTAGFSGDGGPATSAQLGLPAGVALDALGNLYISENANSRVRMVNAATGSISTVAGNGSVFYSGDGGPATSAGVNKPGKVAVDAAGNIYIPEQSNRIRKVAAGTGIITTVAGSGSSGCGGAGDGGPATGAKFFDPNAVAVDNAGNLYITDIFCSRVRKVTAATGIITTVAGGGASLGDGGPATSAQVSSTSGVTLDSAGDLYIAQASGRIRKVDAAGTITTVAGNGTAAFSGDGGTATRAQLNTPRSVALDAVGNLYIGDWGNNRIRKVDISRSAMAYPTPTTVGTIDSTDNPQTAILSDIGNAGLTIAPPASGSNPNISTNFAFDSGSTCPELLTSSNPQTLAAGADCTIAIDFEPVQTGVITGTAVETDDSLNIAGSTQTINLTATGVAESTATTVVGAPNPSAYSQSVLFTATVAETTGTITPTGTVQFSIDGTPVGAPVTLVNGKATYSTSTLAVGTHPVIAAYTPDSTNFTASNGSTSQTVTSVASSTTTLSAAPATSMYGNTVTLTAVVSPSFATGTVSFYEGSTLLGTASLDNTGTAVLPINTLNAGVHTIVAKYNGDPIVPASTSNTTQVTVTQRTAPGGGPAIVVTVNDVSRTTTQSNPPFTYSASGQLVNGDTYATAIGGTASYSTAAGTTAGTYSITVSGLNSANYSISFVPGTLTVTAAASTTTLVASPTSTQYGDPVTLTATVTSGATGTVSFYDGAALLGTGTVSNGIATLTTTTLVAGSHTITAVYNGDATYASSQSNPATVTVAKKQAANGGAALTITVQNASREYGTADPQFNYVVTGALVNSDTYATAVTGAPVYSSTDTATSPAGSTFPVSVSGLTSANYQVAFVNGTLTVVAAPTTTALATSTASTQYGDPVTFTATVAPSGATGTVIFIEGSTVLGTGTVTNGVATLTTSSLPAGSYTITAAYQGDVNYSASTSAPISLTINQRTGPGGTAALTITVANASRAYGQGNPAFSYTVTGTLVNGDTYATAITGVPVYSTTAVPTSAVGGYPVSVADLSSWNYLITVVNGTLTVTKDTPGQSGVTSVTLTSSPNPSLLGQSVTFTATVPTGATGMVQFMDGSTLLGAGTISGTTATFTTSTLALGTHPVAAVYNGDANFSPATSAVDNQAVNNALDFTLTLISAGTQMVIPGNAAPYTVQVAPTNVTYPGTVTFSATGLPTGATISFSPNTVAANGGTQPIKVTVQTAQQHAALNSSIGSAVLALLMLPFATSRRIRKSSRRYFYLLILVLGGIGATAGLTGCGYNGNGFFGQAPQTYTITITATSGTIQHSVNVTLNVQ